MRVNRGFTLIELMIVVAVIGIMAAIAIPYYLTRNCQFRWTNAGYSTEVAAVQCGKDYRSEPNGCKDCTAEAPEPEAPMWVVSCYAGDEGFVTRQYDAREVQFIQNMNRVVLITLTSGKKIRTNLKCLAEQQ